MKSFLANIIIHKHLSEISHRGSISIIGTIKVGFMLSNIKFNTRPSVQPGALCSNASKEKALRQAKGGEGTT